jgi:hypothetical protein
VRYPALRAPGLEGVLPVYESVHKPSKPKHGTKSKGSKYKIVMTKSGGKTVEVHANSIAGIKRAVHGETNFKVFNQQGTNISKYF